MRKTLQALAAFLLLLAWSCQKEESPLIENQITEIYRFTPKHIKAATDLKE